jgi:glycosyltransferase involved in cell wall biosynthesis
MPTDLFQTVKRREDADLVILHVISSDFRDLATQLTANGKRYVAIQYCLATSGTYEWARFWQNAAVVWSYYDLNQHAEADFVWRLTNFYHAPLGVDQAFREHQFDDSPTAYAKRDIDIITSGYVSGPGAEAIEAVWEAAAAVGVKVVHVGPAHVEGIGRKWNTRTHTDVTDEQLANLYGRAKMVSGLRHVEGFEMPVVEGLACGARPVVFDQPSMRYWYTGHAAFIPEDSLEPLESWLSHLLSIGREQPWPVTAAERETVLEKFDWRTIVEGFWQMVEERV